MSTFAIPNENNTFEKQKSGAIAQLVEQRTENPCVPGSIPGGTTKTSMEEILLRFFRYLQFVFRVIVLSFEHQQAFVKWYLHFNNEKKMKE